MKKVIALLLSVLLIFSMILVTAFPSVALANTIISFETKKYDAGTGNYSVISQANAGDIIYIVASLSHLNSLGGITFTLDFDTELFSFDKSKSFTTIVDEKSDVFFNSNNGKISVIWETVSENTAVNDAVFYVAIKVSDAILTDVNATFQAAIVEMFDGTENQKTINCTVHNNPSIMIATSIVPNNVLTLAESVKTLSYNPKNDPDLPKDSLSTIVSAESAFAALTPSQQLAFRDKYPVLYEALSTARTRYYRLAESEAEKLILKEIEDFKKKFEDALKLEVNNVTVDDKVTVNFAYDWMNEILSKDAQKKLDVETKTKLTELYNKIRTLEKEAAEKEEADAEVKDFKNTYGYMFTDAYLESFSIAYDVDGPIVLEAIMVYESLLSETAQKQLTKEYKILQELEDLIEKYTADDKAAAELLNKVADFQKRYAKVYTLNTNNVSIADKTAIEMVISAYESLGNDEEALKEKLTPRIIQLKSLLVVIEELEELQKEQSESKKDETSNGDKEKAENAKDETTSQQNNTQTTPQPDNSGTQDNISGDNVITVTPNTSEKVEVQTVTKWLNKNFVTESGLGWPTIILLLMIGISVCCLISSAVISEYANNLNKQNRNANDE